MSENTERIAGIDAIENLQAALEALLFVTDEPVTAQRLAQILDITPARATSELQALAERLREDGRGIQLLEVAGGWRLYSHPAYHEVIERYVLSWDTRRLSQAALEALAVIAYGQPVTRQAVNAIRGVNSDGVISSLIEKGLVREVGRDTTPGAPILYGTTTTFLEKFGLKSPDDLPPLEEFAPDEETRALIRDRLSGLGTSGPQPASDAQGDDSGLFAEDGEPREIADEDLEPTPLSQIMAAMESDDDDGEGHSSAIDAFFDDLMGGDDDE